MAASDDIKLVNLRQPGNMGKFCCGSANLSPVQAAVPTKIKIKKNSKSKNMIMQQQQQTSSSRDKPDEDKEGEDKTAEKEGMRLGRVHALPSADIHRLSSGQGILIRPPRPMDHAWDITTTTTNNNNNKLTNV